MLNLLELALNNNYIYMGIIGVLIIIIIITIISIKKDRDEMVNKKEEVEELTEEKKEEQEKAKLELEKVVNEMQKNIDSSKAVEDDIKSYEEEQEQKAIISYQELVEAVKNHESSQPHNKVGMEVADTTFIDEVSNINPNVEEKPTLEEVPTLEEIENNEVSEPEVLNVEEEVLKEEKPYEEKKFKSSEVISPIFGRAKVEYPTETIDDTEEEDEFLDSLKDFRKKL